MFRKNVLLILAVAILAGCASIRIRQIVDVERASEIIKQPKILIVDVRTPEEYANGHIEGAVFIPISQMETQLSLWSKLPKDHTAPILIYAEEETHSIHARVLLKEKGYSNVYALKGGFKSWKEAGQPFIKSDLQMSPFHE